MTDSVESMEQHIPEKCDSCILHGTVVGMQICNVEIKRVKNKDIRPDWCPLKEVPEKANHPDYCDNGRFDKGWNACIDEILSK